MFRKTKQSVRKYPILSFIIITALIALWFDTWNKDALARGLLLTASAAALIPASISMNRTFKSGFFGINLLPVTALIMALFLQQGWTALVIALILAGEKPLIAWLRGKTSELLSASHTSYARLLDNFSVPFTIMVLLLGGAIWVISGDALRFLEVVAVASPAPLLLAGPLAYMTGLQQIRAQGTYIKSASILERLAFTGTVLLSKNGILTMNQPKVDTIKAHAGNTKADVLHIATALAGQSSHPLALAIVAEARSSTGVTKAKHANEIPGMGLVGRQKGQTLALGRADLLESEGIELPASFANPSETMVYVAKNDQFIGSISFKDTNRELADKLATGLRRLGVRSLMLASSDTNKATEDAATHAGIKKFQGNLQAADKIKLVENSVPRPVAFIGHANSDPAALTAAEVAITFGEHQSGASDITIEDSSIKTLLATFRIARQTIRKARLVSLLGLIATCMLVGFAASDAFSPLQSAGLQALVAFLAVISATYVRLQTAKQ